MQKPTNLDVDQTGNGEHSLTCDALLQHPLGFEDMRLTRIYPRATVLFAEGQPADGIYLLRSGRVKISISSAIGKKTILRIQQAGSVLGVNSALKNVPYDVTVETIERCRVDLVSRSDFMKLLEKSEVARARVAHTLSSELSDMVEHMRSLVLSQSASEKLVRLLLKWCDEQSEARTEEAAMIPGLTHEEIGQMICTSRETVTRVLAEFRRKRMIRLVGKSIVVSNREALESLAGIERDFPESKSLAV
jgi:CRP/FNR family transcriptional regulator, cyclic AMP receptor protein